MRACARARRLPVLTAVTGVLGRFSAHGLLTRARARTHTRAQWRSDALAPTAVAIQQGCHANGACAGVTAWLLMAAPAALLPALVPTSTAAVTFTVTAADLPISLLALGGTAPAGAAVEVWAAAGAGAALLTPTASVSPWMRLYAGTWTPGSAATFQTPLSLAAGGAATLLVRSTTSGAALSCANALGMGGGDTTLLSDASVSLSQGAALTGAFTPAVAITDACAWDGLALTYSSAAACSPPPAPRAPGIATSAPATLVASLDDLLRALSNPAVTMIEVNSHIALNGSELVLALDVHGLRTLSVEGTNACWADGLDADATTLCSLDAGGLSRVFAVSTGVTLRLAHIDLVNGAAPDGGYGGCVLAEAGATLRLDAATLRNCTSPTGGGGVAVLDGNFVAYDSAFEDCGATVGGGLLSSSGSVSLHGCAFRNNTSRGSSMAVSDRLGGLPGAVGGGAALVNVTGAVEACTFDLNAATTTDVVLLPNPDSGQARAGGLYVSHSALMNVTASTFTRNVASFGGGADCYGSYVTFTGCAFIGNIATNGYGGGLFTRDAPSIAVTSCLVAGNSAGGRTGGGVSALNSTMTVSASTLRDNSAPAGCGGSLGLDTASHLFVLGGTVVANSSAASGGGACCNLCSEMNFADSFLLDNAAFTSSGGALFASSTPVALRNVSLWRNTAMLGGAVSAVACNVSVDGGSFVANTATWTHGGAVLHDADGEAVAALRLTGVQLTNNSADAGGGAVAALGSSSVTIGACTFIGNGASGDAPAGGALYALDVAALAVDGTVFRNNSVVVQPHTQAALGYATAPVAATSSAGGGVWLGANAATNASLSGCDFSDHSAPSGAAVYATGAVTLTLSGTTFLRDTSLGTSSEGGALATSATVVATVSGGSFTACAAVRGGGGWHGGASVVTYTGTTFASNIGLPGDNVKGTALYVAENASVTVASSNFLRNSGTASLADGTVALGGATASQLTVTDSLFDGNDAMLGGCLYVSAVNQGSQLTVSGVTFRNNYANLAASILYTESDNYAPLTCTPTVCDTTTNNTAALARKTVATPPVTIGITIPTTVRSGAPLPVNITLHDGFSQLVKDWASTTASIESFTALSGSLRSFYAHGYAFFPGLALSGNVSAVFSIIITISGPELFGSNDDTRVLTRNVSIAACETDETFDATMLRCACADGFGLDDTTGACVHCATDAVVPVPGGPCQTCPALSLPSTPYACECIAGYFGTLVAATGVCTQARSETSAARRRVCTIALTLARASRAARSVRRTPTAARATRRSNAARAPRRATRSRPAPPHLPAACAARGSTATRTATAQ